ncbi:hypothetical protein ACJX0J_021807 [Zea mays]
MDLGWFSLDLSPLAALILSSNKSGASHLILIFMGPILLFMSATEKTRLHIIHITPLDEDDQDLHIIHITVNDFGIWNSLFILIHLGFPHYHGLQVMYSMFYVLDLNVYLLILLRYSYYLPSLQWDLEENKHHVETGYDVFGFGVLWRWILEERAHTEMGGPILLLIYMFTGRSLCLWMGASSVVSQIISYILFFFPILALLFYIIMLSILSFDFAHYPLRFSDYKYKGHKIDPGASTVEQDRCPQEEVDQQRLRR